MDKNSFKDLTKGLGLSVFVISLLMILVTLSNVFFSGCIAYSFYLATVKDAKEFSDYIIPFCLGIICLILSFALSLIQDRVSLNLSSRTRAKLRSATYEKALKLGTIKNHYLPHSSLTTMALEGVEELDSFITGFLPSLIYGLTMPLLMFAICLIINFTISFASPMSWVYGTSMIAILPFIPLMIGIMSMSISKVFGKYWDVYLKMGSTFSDVLKGLTILKDFSTSKRKGKLLDEQSEDFRKITMKVLITELVSLTILDLISFGGVGSGMAISLYYSANINTSEVWSLAIFFILIVFQFFIPMRNVASLAMVAGRGMIALKKIKSFLNLPEPKWGDKEPSNFDIKVDNVTFKYPDSKKEIAVEGINFSIKENGLYGLVGISGSGKSTLANLLMGSLIPTSGKVEYGNCSIQDISKQCFFKNIGLVQGFASIPSGSIREIFHFYNSNLNDDQIKERMNAFGLKDLYNNPQGLDYQLKEFSKNISVGERQRLIMSASLSVYHKIWIFDEVSSALDKESREKIDSQIYDLAKDSIVLMISHRLVETEDAKEIFVMKESKIVERGTKQELLNQNGEYKSMYEKQSMEVNHE